MKPLTERERIKRAILTENHRISMAYDPNEAGLILTEDGWQEAP